MTGFTFFESYYKAISTLPEEYQGDAYKAIAAYMFDGTEPSAESGLAYTIWLAIKPNLDKSIKRSEAGSKRSNGDQTENKRESNANQKRIKAESNEDQAENKRDTGTDTGTDTDPKGKKNPTGSKKAASASTSRPPRHKHGEYGHVMLTDEQYASLVSSHGQDETDKAITCVDEYCEQTGKAYKNYKIVLEKWGYKSAQETRAPANRGQPTGKPNRFHNFPQGDYDMDALERALIKN